MVLILKRGVVLILNQFNIAVNRKNFGTKQSGLKIEVVLILRWSLSEVPLYKHVISKVGPNFSSLKGKRWQPLRRRVLRNWSSVINISSHSLTYSQLILVLYV